MEAEFIIKLIMGLMILLALLMFLLFYNPSKKKVSNSKKTDSSKIDNEELILLVKVLKDKKSDTKRLGETLNLIIKEYGEIKKNKSIYMDILHTICVHPNSNKDIIVNFDRELQKLNPQYKKSINDAVVKGLNSR